MGNDLTNRPAVKDQLMARLSLLELRYEEVTRALADPEVLGDPDRYMGFAREHARLEEIVTPFRRYKKVLEEIEESEGLLETETDPAIQELAREDLKRLEEERAELESELKRALIPEDPNDRKPVIMEIRAGTGGEEAALFAADLFRMYGRYAERHGFKTEVLSSSPTDLGGLKEVIFAIEGKRVWSRLKYEGGVHRVQRVPVTESQGRIHTSTATVAVLPEAEEVDVKIDPDDLRIDIFCSSGHGGQSVNTTYSAVRITHIPTGIVVSCQDERSQLQNKQRAMRILRSRLKALAEQEQNQSIAQARRAQVGTGERSEKIRTYNFPQNRVTDHRIGFTTHRLQEILDGDLDELIDALAQEDQRKAIQQVAGFLQ